MSSSAETQKSQESETLEQPKPPKDQVQDQETRQDQENPISIPPMSSSAETHKPQESETLEQPKPPKDTVQDQETKQDQENQEEEEEEEEGECGFCLFMKAGGCKDTFIEWENCVMEGEKNNEDIVQKCFEVTAALKVCMQAHPDHYGPLLDAQEAAEKEALEELEKEREEEKEKEKDMEYAAARESRRAKK